MNKDYPWLRFIEGPQDEAPAPKQEQQAPDSSQDKAAPADHNPEKSGEVDYKAKYEAVKKHSREWETKAKENLAAAKKLQEIEDAGKTELEKLTDQLAKERAEKQALEVETSRLRIAAQHGLSADDAELFLHGDVETMTRQAEALAKRVVRQMEAEDPYQGRGGQPNTKTDAVNWAKSLFGKQDTN